MLTDVGVSTAVNAIRKKTSMAPTTAESVSATSVNAGRAKINPLPVYAKGGGVARYHSHSQNQYTIPVDVDEAEEEEIILALLMEIAAHVV